MQLLSGSKIIPIKVDGTNYLGAAGTSDLTSEAIDTEGAESVVIGIMMGTITSGAVTSAKVTQCDTSGGTYADLLGSSQTIADTESNNVVLWEIVRPRERYLKTVLDRGTQNAVANAMFVVLNGVRSLPATQSALVIGPETTASPAEGTA